MLQTRYSREDLDGLLLPRDQWRPFPAAADRRSWESLLGHSMNRRRVDLIVAEAETLVGQPWPALPATRYMEYRRSGDRQGYQVPYFKRRANLARLVLAECMEHEGRFTDEIINGIWALCEETTWCPPAHAYPRELGYEPDLLPQGARPVVDLFAAQTAAVLAETWYLVGEELDRVTPLIRERLRREVLDRVVSPVMDRADFAWLRQTFNWNTWCSANTLSAGLYLLEDPKRTADLAWQLMGACDVFLGAQLPDGGCSEGPNYWGVAPGAMVLLLELLYSRSDGRISVYDEPLVAALGRYLPRVHLDGPWFATFADCPPLVSVNRAPAYRYGERIGDESMTDLVLLSMRGWKADGCVDPALTGASSGGGLTHALGELFWIPADAEPTGVVRPLQTWFPDLQVMVAREEATPGRGLVVAAKGGHNAEYHNHNDLGQFIVLADGQPMIVDVGVGTYTAKTFSSDRYETWTIRSSGHNVPIVNGQEQQNGAEYRATDVACHRSATESVLSMDLVQAYPEEAGLASLVRTFCFSRTAPASLTVTDVVRTSGGALAVEVHIFTPGTCDVTTPGQVVLSAEGKQLLMTCDPEQASIRAEDWPIRDGRLRRGWGDRLTRLTVSYGSKSGSAECRLTFRVVSA